MKPSERYINIGIQIHLREWLPESPDPSGTSFVLLHGLSSNARTWDFVAEKLAQAGFPTFAIDQRGHGLSDKPAEDYDFQTISYDLAQVLEQLKLERVILVGQSWGANVLLDFAAHYPGKALHYVFVDGGFLDLSTRGDWESISSTLRPPDLSGMPRADLAKRIQAAHSKWSEAAIEMTLDNLETLPNGTVRPWLSLEYHMSILWHLYNQQVDQLFPKVQQPVLICAADDGSEWSKQKRAMVERAVVGLRQAEVIWFNDTAHDIHIDKPDVLAAALVKTARVTA